MGILTMFYSFHCRDFLHILLNLLLVYFLRQSLYSPGWPQTQYPHASASQLLGVQVCTTTTGLLFFLLAIGNGINFFSFWWDWDLNSQLHACKAALS
jgi:hypothetical protein